MADFGILTGIKKFRSALKTARFGSVIKKIITEPTTRITDAASGQAANIVNSIRRFFDATPGQTGEFNRVSTRMLETQDSVAQIKLKQRAIAEVTAQTREEFAMVLDQFARGRISIESFGEVFRAIIRKQSLAAAIIGVGGIGNLTENVLTAVNRQISEQFDALDGFIDKLATSEPRDVSAKDRARARQYANSAYAVASNAARQFQIDQVGVNNIEERRRLGGAEHCIDCLELAGEGWQPAGTLPPIGQGTVCGGNCKCWIQVRVKDPNDVDMNDQTP